MPFEIPDNWEWCKLGDIVDFQGGYAYKSNTYVNQSDWQVIRIGNVKNDNLVLDTQPVFVEEVIGRETKKYLLQKDDILFTMTGTKGKRDYFYSVKVPSVQKKLLLNQRVGCLRRFSSEVNIDFLCFALKGEYVLDAIFSTETGNVSQGNIGSENTLNLNIAIPPLAEQRRIVSEIERWFSLIDIIENGKQDLQTSIKQARNKILDLAIHGKLVPQDPNDEPAIELLKRINPSFTPCDNGHSKKLPKDWIVAQLNNIAEIKNGYAFKSSKYLSSNGVRIIRISNVQDGYIEDKMPQFYPFEEMETLKDFMLKEGDMLMSLTGNVGRVGILTNNLLPAALNQRVAHIKECSNVVEKKYLFYLFQTSDFLKDCLKSGKGVAQLNISTEWLKHYFILLPPLSEQQRIVAKIEELFSILDNIQKSLEA